MKYEFYDTSSLLAAANRLFSKENTKILISSISLNELENIKTSNIKDNETKSKARKVISTLLDNSDRYSVVIYEPFMIKPIECRHLEITNDMKILACAIHEETHNHPDNMYFYTNDFAQATIANLFFGEDTIKRVEEPIDSYTGYKEISFHDDALTDLYSNLDRNLYNLNTNEYLIVRDMEKNVVDRLCWTGEVMRPISFPNFSSKQFGEVRPLKGDVYQMLAADSLANNTITLLKGPAGTGKSYLALGFLLHKLEKHQIDKIVIFCNTVATKGSAKLGYYPGDRNSKLLDSQIGNFLSSKLGDKIAVERMVDDGELVLLPLSDVRGYDTSGMRAGVYITEAQNLDVQLMKLALQRIGQDSICIIDGDPLTQVDDESYAGENNGMRRVSQVFRGTEVYGEVELKNIHRSRIANIAQNM